MTMYPVPVIAAKVIDAETKEPITNFTIFSGWIKGLDSINNIGNRNDLLISFTEHF